MEMHAVLIFYQFYYIIICAGESRNAWYNHLLIVNVLSFAWIFAVSTKKCELEISRAEISFGGASCVLIEKILLYTASSF